MCYYRLHIQAFSCYVIKSASTRLKWLVLVTSVTSLRRRRIMAGTCDSDWTCNWFDYCSGSHSYCVRPTTVKNQHSDSSLVMTGHQQHHHHDPRNKLSLFLGNMVWVQTITGEFTSRSYVFWLTRPSFTHTQVASESRPLTVTYSDHVCSHLHLYNSDTALARCLSDTTITAQCGRMFFILDSLATASPVQVFT